MGLFPPSLDGLCPKIPWTIDDEPCRDCGNRRTSAASARRAAAERALRQRGHLDRQGAAHVRRRREEVPRAVQLRHPVQHVLRQARTTRRTSALCSPTSAPSTRTGERRIKIRIGKTCPHLGAIGSGSGAPSAIVVLDILSAVVAGHRERRARVLRPESDDEPRRLRRPFLGRLRPRQRVHLGADHAGRERHADHPFAEALRLQRLRGRFRAPRRPISTPNTRTARRWSRARPLEMLTSRLRLAPSLAPAR